MQSKLTYFDVENHDNALSQLIKKQGGFLRVDQIEQLQSYQELRLRTILVRCGSGRFISPLQDVLHFVKIIEEHSKLLSEKTNQPESFCGDYVRDIGLLA